MIIGAFVVHIRIPEARSLKDKRRHIKSLLTRLQREFNISVAEDGHHDMWQSSEIALVSVSNARGAVETQMRNALHWIENNCPDLDIVDVAVEWR